MRRRLRDLGQGDYIEDSDRGPGREVEQKEDLGKCLEGRLVPKSERTQERVGEDRTAACFSGSGNTDVRILQRERRNQPIQESGMKRTRDKTSGSPDIFLGQKEVCWERGWGWVHAGPVVLLPWRWRCLIDTRVQGGVGAREKQTAALGAAV